jgi:hypothetical protein
VLDLLGVLVLDMLGVLQVPEMVKAAGMLRGLELLRALG